LPDVVPELCPRARWFAVLVVPLCPTQPARALPEPLLGQKFMSMLIYFLVRATNPCCRTNTKGGPLTSARFSWKIVHLLRNPPFTNVCPLETIERPFLHLSRFSLRLPLPRAPSQTKVFHICAHCCSPPRLLAASLRGVRNCSEERLIRRHLVLQEAPYPFNTFTVFLLAPCLSLTALSVASCFFLVPPTTF
jgi:hypothetical protein